MSVKEYFPKEFKENVEFVKEFSQYFFERLSTITTYFFKYFQGSSKDNVDFFRNRFKGYFGKQSWISKKIYWSMDFEDYSKNMSRATNWILKHFFFCFA